MVLPPCVRVPDAWVMFAQSLLTKSTRAVAQSLRSGARQMSSATEQEAKGESLLV